ncbi:Prefoldin subunit 5 [Rhizoclosmatium hyalinum]|nr:Prefoldin subunit 5 [Rhizoclosmatium hyalinum]
MSEVGFEPTPISRMRPKRIALDHSAIRPDWGCFPIFEVIQEVEKKFTAMASDGPINLADLPLQQLQAVKNQMDEEIQHLTQSYAQLKQAQVKFSDSIESLNNIDGRKDGKKNVAQDERGMRTETQSFAEKVLIPLTSSLYVPGTLADVSKVIVDIGTGYMIDKSIPDAKDFYKTKVTFLRENLDGLQETITQRENQYKVLIDVMNMKMTEAQQAAKK